MLIYRGNSGAVESSSLESLARLSPKGHASVFPGNSAVPFNRPRRRRRPRSPIPSLPSLLSLALLSRRVGKRDTPYLHPLTPNKRPLQNPAFAGKCSGCHLGRGRFYLIRTHQAVPHLQPKTALARQRIKCVPRAPAIDGRRIKLRHPGHPVPLQMFRHFALRHSHPQTRRCIDRFCNDCKVRVTGHEQHTRCGDEICRRIRPLPPRKRQRH
jgi:hypothetical protein